MGAFIIIYYQLVGVYKGKLDYAYRFEALSEVTTAEDFCNAIRQKRATQLKGENESVSLVFRTIDII